MSAIQTISTVSLCFGCSACATACVASAIRMESDALGFKKAVLDSAACIRCGVCASVCPALHHADKWRPVKAFYGWNRNDAVRAASSSGGVFSALADSFVREGGIVFGAIFDAKSGTIRHASSESADIASIRGSKYVQSDMGHVFRSVKDALLAGRKVLFCGTPCQTAGLRRFLRSPFANLMIVDFICHGVGAPAVFTACLARHVREHDGSPAEAIEFRNKSHGWRNSSTRIRFRNGMTYTRRNILDPFFQGFVDGCYFNDACYNCPFDDTCAADIRLSDFWGHASFGSIPEHDKGLSLLFANTEQGAAFLSTLDSMCVLRELPVGAAVDSQRHSLDGRQTLLPHSKRFLADLAEVGPMGALERCIGWSLLAVVIHKFKRVGFGNAWRRLSRRLFRKR